MSIYQRVLEIAQAQAAAAAAGDLNTATVLLEKRGTLIATAPPASAHDKPIIRAILELDRDIASAFRRRMIEIRDEALTLRNGQQALAGYSRRGPAQPVALNLFT